MISIFIVSALGVLALLTQAGVAVVEKRYPAQGKAVDVTGASINVVDIGPREAREPPLLLIHGASSNLEELQGQPTWRVVRKTGATSLLFL